MATRHRIEGHLELSDYMSIKSAIREAGISDLNVVFTSERRRLHAQEESPIVTVLCVSIPMSELLPGQYEKYDTDITHRFPQTQKVIDAGPKDYLWFNNWNILEKSIQLYFVHDIHRAGCGQNLLNILRRF